MTGQLRLRPGALDPYVRAWWALDDGRVLELRDVRRFGRIGVVPAGEYASLPTLAAQGPEPWDPVLDDGGLWQRPEAQPRPDQDAAAVAATRRRRRQHLRRRGPVAGRHPPRPPVDHPRGGRPPAHRPAHRARAGHRQRRHHPPRLPHPRRRARPQPAGARCLRPRRRTLPPLRHRAPAHGHRRQRHHATARSASAPLTFRGSVRRERRRARARRTRLRTASVCLVADGAAGTVVATVATTQRPRGGGTKRAPARRRRRAPPPTFVDRLIARRWRPALGSHAGDVVGLLCIALGHRGRHGGVRRRRRTGRPRARHQHRHGRRLGPHPRAGRAGRRSASSLVRGTPDADDGEADRPRSPTSGSAG